MIRKKLSNDIWVPASLQEVWDFMASPSNLAKLTPARYGASVKTDPGPMVDGKLVEITINPFGLPLRLKWISRLVDIVDGPELKKFVDVQQSGPFAYWRHDHIFEAGRSMVAKGEEHIETKMREPGTWIRDRVEYEVPFGVLGLIGHAIYLERDLQNMFAYRSQFLREFFSKPRS